MRKKLFTTSNLVRISLLSALAFILMYLNFPLPMLFPPFMKIDFSDVPALIGGFSMGPLAGVFIQFIKCLIYFLTKTETAGIGPAASFISGTALVVPASLIYQRLRSKKNALVGMAIGTAVMTVVMAFVNYYAIFPLYIAVMGYSEQALIGMGATITARITDLKSLIVLGTVPFNIFTGVTTSVVTLALYKHISRLFKRM